MRLLTHTRTANVHANDVGLLNDFLAPWNKDGVTKIGLVGLTSLRHTKERRLAAFVFK